MDFLKFSFFHPSPEMIREVFSPRDELCVPVVFEAFHGEPFGEARSQRDEEMGLPTMGLRKVMVQWSVESWVVE